MKTTWDDLYKLWHEQAVPDVEVVAFDKNIHLTTTPWVRKEGLKEGKMYHFKNPVNDTGHMLAKLLRGKHSEYIAAYKLYAYGLSTSFHKLHDYPLDEIRRVLKHETGTFWGRNAKHVLPNPGGTLYDHRDEASNWQEFVVKAAAAWNQIADEWVVVEILGEYF